MLAMMELDEGAKPNHGAQVKGPYLVLVIE
jgi:hypothetical protein